MEHFSFQTGYPEKMIAKISDDIVYRSLKVQTSEHLFIDYDLRASEIAHEICQKSLALGASVDFRLRDQIMQDLMCSGLNMRYLKRPDASFLARIQQSDCYVSLRCSEGNIRGCDPERMKIWAAHQKDLREEIVDEQRTRRCGLSLPTPFQAEQDAMSYDQYLEVYWNACNLPWEEIEKAQDILIQRLDAGEELHFLADLNNPDPRRRTDLKMSIQGMTFANSTITKNYPGSEVFSAPVLSSVQGSYFSPGRFFYHGKRIKDIYLKFENGIVTDSWAAEGAEQLKEILDFDSGSRHVGEIGIGTNRELIEDVSDTLLFEKKGASFHIALGSPYHFEYYNGKRVSLDNGGQSNIHWDLTQMLNRLGGSQVLLDGHVIQANGLFLDPALEVLNPRS